MKLKTVLYVLAVLVSLLAIRQVIWALLVYLLGATGFVPAGVALATIAGAILMWRAALRLPSQPLNPSDARKG